MEKISISSDNFSIDDKPSDESTNVLRDVNFKYIVINPTIGQDNNGLILENMKQLYVSNRCFYKKIIELITENLHNGSEDIGLFCLCRMEKDNVWQGLSILISSDKWKIFHDKDTERTKHFKLGINVSNAIKEKFGDEIPKHLDDKNKCKINLSKDSCQPNASNTEQQAFLNIQAKFDEFVGRKWINLSRKFTRNGELMEVISEIKKKVSEDAQYVPKVNEIQNLVSTLASQNFAIEQKVNLIDLLILFKVRNGSLINKDKITKNIMYYFAKIKEKRDFDSVQAIIEFLSRSKIDEFLSTDEFIQELDASLKLLGSSMYAESSLVSKRSEIHREENAYNQRGGYWYRSEDIHRISNLWFKEYRDAVDIRENMDVTQLRIFLSDYKTLAHKKPTLIPLNVDGNHWISIAIVPPSNENRNIVLYKDSLQLDGHEREIYAIFKKYLGNISFKVNKELDGQNQQKDGSSCGSFMLANLKVIAEKISSANRHSFLEEFNTCTGKFKTHEEIEKLRDEEFSKLYANYMRREKIMKEIEKHHRDELSAIKNYINERIEEVYTGSLKQQLPIELSIATSEEEIDISSNKYNYKYCFYLNRADITSLPEHIKELLEKVLLARFKDGMYWRIPHKNAVELGIITYSEQKTQLNLNEITHDLLSYNDILSLRQDIKKLEIQTSCNFEKSTSKVMIKVDWLKKLIEKIEKILELGLATQNPVSGRVFDSLQKIIQLAISYNNLELNDCILSFLLKEDFDLNFCKGGKNILLEYIVTFFNNIIAQMFSNISVFDNSLIKKFVQKIETAEYIEKIDVTNIGKYILEIVSKSLNKELIFAILDLKLFESKLIKRFSPEVRDNINLYLSLEQAFIEENIENIIDQCSKLVKSGKRFDIKYWDKLESRFNDGRVKEILITLVEYGSVEITAEIKKKIIEYLSCKDNFLEDVKADKSILKTLVRVKELKINELEIGFIKEALSDKDSRSDVLDVIELALLPVRKLDLGKQQEALDQVLDQISTSTEKIKFLEQLPQKNIELRVNAYEKLLTELSNADENLLQNIQVNSILENITRSLSYPNIELANIITLINKFKELLTRFKKATITAELEYKIDLLPVFNWLIDHVLLMGDGKQDLLNQLENFTQDLNDFLKELTQSLIDKNIDPKAISEGLIRIALFATINEIRQNAIGLIETKLDKLELDASINYIFDKLKQLSSVEIDEQTLKLSDSLEQGSSVISYLKNHIDILKELSPIKALFDLINSDGHKEYHQKIVAILLQIDRNQHIYCNWYLLIRAELEQLLPEGVTKELLTIFAIASRDQEFRLEQKSILRLAEFLSTSSSDLDMRIIAAIILNNQIKRMHKKFIGPYITDKIFTFIKDVAIAKEESSDHNLLISIVFQTLDFLVIDEQQIDSWLINNYYKRLSSRLFDNEKESKWLNYYIKNTEMSNKKKYLLLRALNESLLVVGRYETKYLINKHQGCRLKNILTKILLECIDEKSDQKEEEFNDYIKKLERAIGAIETSKTKITTEDLLLELIKNQGKPIDKPNLGEVNNLLWILWKSEKAREIVFNKSLPKSILELTKSYLIEKFNSYVYQSQADTKVETKDDWHKIEGLVYQLAESIAVYRIEIIDQLFSKINSEIIELNTKEEFITDLIKFFRVMEPYQFTVEEKEQFFSREITEKSSVRDWSIKFHSVVAAKLIAIKIPDIVHVSPALRNCSKKILFKSIFSNSSANAYNQSNNFRYYYSGNDISRISSTWMKKFNDNGKVIHALELSNQQNIYEILPLVLKAYKDNKVKKPLYIPLNIAANHWVSLVVLPNTQDDKIQTIVLYKDSLGDTYNHEREEVEDILRETFGDDLIFKFSKSLEQITGASSGIFALANLKIIASNKVYKNFENYQEFATQKYVDLLRERDFPSEYAKSLCEHYRQIYINNKIKNHHKSQGETEIFQILEDADIEDKTKVTISVLPKLPSGIIDANCADYSYSYQIEIHNGITPFERKNIQMKITYILRKNGINYQLYGKDTIVIEPKQPTKNHSKLRGLATLKVADYISEEQLRELAEYLGTNDLKTLRIRIGLEESVGDDKHHCLIDDIDNSTNDHISLLNTTNLALMKKSKWGQNLHIKLARLLRMEATQENLSFEFLNSIAGLLDKVNDDDKLKDLAQTLDIIYDYDLKADDVNYRTGKNLVEILNGSGHRAHEIHQLAINKSFLSASQSLNLDELKQEILKLNPDQNYLDTLLTEYDHVIQAEEGRSLIYQLPFKQDNKVIKEWREEQIKDWSQKVRSNPFGNSEEEKKQLLYEKLAVAKRAVQVFYNEKITPRHIQMLSLLLLLNNKTDHGRLAQINTGEGKTTIVAMLAAIKALEGIEDTKNTQKRIHQVDIITSSSELAKPQSEEQKKYFALFDLTVSHNSSGNDLEKQETYKANIVYGAASDFQGDILRDEYNKLGTRGNRKCNIAIVDEVDSMLIDGKNHIVMLSNPMPAMDYLEPVLATIWNQLLIASQHIVKGENDKIVYREQKHEIDVDGEERNIYVDRELLESKTQEDTLKKVTESYVRKLLRGKILDSGKYENEELLDLTKEEIKELQNQDKALAIYEDNLRREISIDKKPPLSHPRIEIPKHLRSLVLSTQLSKWIDSAISAMFRYDLGKHYVLKDDRFIAPVDASNTGIVQGNMIWSDGLHQFLQLKHGCKITPENLTTNLISNVAFFKRYGDKIFGLTGTLGSSKARDLLHKHYKLDSVIIPPFRSRRYKELKSIISSSENVWYRNIAESCLSKLEQNRGVLVITEYINEVDNLKKLLETEYQYPSDKINVYKTEKDADIVKQELKAGEIILATNIAGRGTDIKPSPIIEENGGLHVCVTFLPRNQRVEDQNIGRTSRTGNKGSAQFVLLNRNFNLDFLRMERNKTEMEDLIIADSEIKIVFIKDEWFRQFCVLLETIDESSKTKNKSIYVKSVEERFAIWLKEQDKELDAKNICLKSTDNGSSSCIESIEKRFESFKQDINQDIKIEKNNLIKNHTFFVLEGNEKLLNEDSAKIAITSYTKAIDLDPYFAVNAYYNRACARIAAYGNSDKYEEEARKAISDFKEARRIIEENLKPLLSIIQKSSKSEVVLEQLEHKLALYNTQIQAIDAAIGKGDGYVEDQLQQLEKQEKNGNIEQTKINLIEGFIEEYKYKIIKIGDTACFEVIKLRLKEIENNSQLFYELLNSIEQKKKIDPSFIEEPTLEINLLDQLLNIQKNKKETLKKSNNNEDISKLESSIQEIIADRESLTQKVSDNTDLTVIIRRLTRYRNILEKAVDQGPSSIKKYITYLDNLIIKFSGISTYSDRLIVFEEFKKSLLLDKNYKVRTKEELSKKNTEISKNNIKELDTLINKIEKHIKKVDQSIQILLNFIRSESISSQESRKDSKWLIKLDLEISMLEAYRKDLRGISESEKRAISDQKARFFKKNEKGESTSEKDIDGINKIEKGIIGVSLSNKNKMKIKFKPMREALSEEENADLFVEEIREYEKNGCIGSFEVEEIKPIHWWSVIGLFIIGLVQLVVGAVLTVCTLGVMASFGSGLMSEGVSDMITAVKDGIINRDFNWESWGVQKAISLAVSVICAGLSALKNAVMAACKTVQTAAKAVVETTKQIAQSTWKLVAKSTAIALSKGVAKECVTQIIDYGVSKGVMPNIEKEISKLFEKPIKDTLEGNDSVRMMFELDAKNGNKRYESQIKKRAIAILSSESENQNSFGSALKSVLHQVALSQLPGLSTAKKAYDAFAAIEELNQILPKFIEELKNIIDEIAELAKHEKASTESLEQKSQSQNVNSTDDITHLSSASHEENFKNGIDLSNANRNHQQAKKTVVEVRSSSEIVGVMSVGVASTVTAVIANKLIKPATDSLVGFGIDKCYNEIEKRQDDRIKTRHEHIKKLKDEEDKEADKKKESKRKADERFIKDRKKAEEQLRSGAQKFSPRDEDDIKAYADREKKHLVIKDKDGKIISEFGKEYASTGKRSVTLIKSDYNENGITHYEAPSGQKSTDTYSCVADAIAAQTGQTPHRVEALMKANESYVERIHLSWDDLGNLDEYQNLLRQRGLGGLRAKIWDTKEKNTGQSREVEITQQDLLNAIDSFRHAYIEAPVSVLNNGLNNSHPMVLTGGANIAIEAECKGQKSRVINDLDILMSERTRKALGETNRVFIPGIGFMDVDLKGKKTLGDIRGFVKTENPGIFRQITEKEIEAKLKASNNEERTIRKGTTDRQDIKTLQSKREKEDFIKTQRNKKLFDQESNT